MAQLLMPKATAVWLIENTTLTFKQISAFCGLNLHEIQAIADGEVSNNIQGLNPILNRQVTQAEIDRCQADETATLQMMKPDISVSRAKEPRYTPISKRQDKPDGIAWLLKNHGELTDAQIARLIGTTKNTISSIRDRTHWNISNIKASNPVLMGLCSAKDFQDAVDKATRRIERQRKLEERAKKKAEAEKQAAQAPAVDAPAFAETPAAEPVADDDATAEKTA